MKKRIQKPGKSRKYIKPWQTQSLGLMLSTAIAYIVLIMSQDYLLGLASLFLAIGLVFLPGLEKVEVGSLGIFLIIGYPVGTNGFTEIDKQWVPQADGPVAIPGWHWSLRGLTAIKTVEARMDTEKIEQLSVYANNGIPVVFETDATYRISNPHQFLLHVGDERKIKKGVNELMEAAIREVSKTANSTDLTTKPEHQETIKAKMLQAVDKAEKKFGVDIFDIFVGQIRLPKKIEDALELKEQNRIYAETRQALEIAGVPKDKLEEVSQLNLGVATKEIKEFKVDVGETTAEVVAALFGKKFTPKGIIRP